MKAFVGAPAPWQQTAYGVPWVPAGWSWTGQRTVVHLLINMSDKYFYIFA